MLLNVQLQIRRSTLKKIVRSVLRLLGCIFWLVWPENLRPCVSVLQKLITPEPLWIGPTCIWRFLLRISSGIKSRNSDLNSWDTLYIKVGRDSLIGIATLYGLDGAGDRIPVGGARFFTPAQRLSRVYPSSCTVVKADGAWRWSPIPSKRRG